MEEINKLNFDDLYKENHEDVDEIYEIFIKILESKDKYETKNLINNLFVRYKPKKYILENIIKKKYVYSKKILEEDLNKESYFDFIFKIISLLLFEQNITYEDNYGIDELKKIHMKLLENKNILDKDKLLKNYEKILLLIDVYSSELLYKDDYIIHYFHIKNIEKNSPLFFAYKFLYNFINDLDYNSIFYYPLLSIDGGLYEINYKKKHGHEYISTYGFNMLSLDKIKEHLQNLIPEILIWPKYIEDVKAKTNPLNGNVILNINEFKNINIDKNELDEFSSKHYAFIIKKILIYELFGHKKSLFSKEGKNYNSIISFRNELGELNIIDSNDSNNNIFKDTKEIFEGNNRNIFRGDSGYFIEYFLGKINNEYTLAIINTIEKETNLSKLLDSKLWHRDISTFKEYLKMKSICLALFDEKNIDNNGTIYEEIKKMKEKIAKNNIKIENKEFSKNIQVKLNSDEKIIQIFNDIWKKKKDIIIKKRKDASPDKKDEEKKGINNFRKSFFAEFTHGFYRK